MFEQRGCGPRRVGGSSVLAAPCHGSELGSLKDREGNCITVAGIERTRGREAWSEVGS